MWARNLTLTHPAPESHLATMPKSATLGECEGGNQPDEGYPDTKVPPEVSPCPGKDRLVGSGRESNILGKLSKSIPKTERGPLRVRCCLSIAKSGKTDRRTARSFCS